MVRSIAIHDDGVVDVTVSLTTPGCPIRNHFQPPSRRRSARSTASPASTSTSTCSPTREGGAAAKLGRRRAARGRARAGLERHLHRLGQGRRRQVLADRQPRRGAGRRGQAVGVLDADVWGYSIPRMFGSATQRPRSRRSARSSRSGADGIKVMSIGFFLDEDAAVVWRGPMLHKALTPVPRGRGLGRARLPARRPAARAPATSR